MSDLTSRARRYVDELSGSLKLAYRSKDLLAYGLRERLREGYTRKDLRADLLASLVVGAVTLPLALALAIACDLPPQHGVYTAIVAGVICALLGGTRFLVTGPTAAFVVILVPIVHKFGLGGLLVAGMMAGAILVLMGLIRMGKLVQVVPHPVTSGLTVGIAVVVILFQLKSALGITLPLTSEHTFDYLGQLWDARAQVNWWDAGVAVVTLALLFAMPRVLKAFPAPIIPLVLVTLAAALIAHFVPAAHIATIGSQFSTTVGGEAVRGIPPLPPVPTVPWTAAGLALDYHTLRELLPSAFAIAILGALESLKAASAADGMANPNTRHEPNSELIALGIANIVVPFFGGIAATGALARTATNIRAGARSPLAAAFQAIVVLASTIALAPLVAYLPIAALGALVVFVAVQLAEVRHFVRLLRIAPRNDVVVMLTCFVLTVAFDMVIAVGVGIVLAALLFMRRMSVLTKVDLETATSTGVPIPGGVRLYEIAGPMFFGAAKTALEALHVVGSGSAAHTYIINFEHVPTIDATALVAFESVLDRLARSNIKVILSGVNAEVLEILGRANLPRVAYAPNIETAASMAAAGS